MITRLNSLGFNELVAEYEVTGSAATTITFDGLDINSDGGYTIVADIIGTTGTAAEYSIAVNGYPDTTANYTSRFIYTTGTSLSTALNGLVGNPCWGVNGTAGIICHFTADITMINGYYVLNGNELRNSTANSVNVFSMMDVQQTNITSLSFYRYSGTASMDVGSKIKIYRWKQGIKTLNSLAQGRLVWEHTVTGSAVSSVTATGLDILRDGSYKVIVGAIATGGTRVDCRMYVNGDTADGNYTTRYISGSGTTVATGSQSIPLCGVLETTASTLDYVVGDVSLVNGYMCFNMSVNIVTSASLHFGKHNVSQSNITQLSFVAPSGNTYAAGSKFYILRAN